MTHHLHMACSCSDVRSRVGEGYIGGSVLSRLFTHPGKSDFDITALVRSPEKAKKLEDFGVKTTIGSLKDTALLEKLAQDAHVVFNTVSQRVEYRRVFVPMLTMSSQADSDDLDATTALLAGLKQRHAQTGDVPILIHTSGTGRCPHVPPNPA